MINCTIWNAICCYISGWTDLVEHPTEKPKTATYMEYLVTRKVLNKRYWSIRIYCLWFLPPKMWCIGDADSLDTYWPCRVFKVLITGIIPEEMDLFVKEYNPLCHQKQQVLLQGEFSLWHLIWGELVQVSPEEIKSRWQFLEEKLQARLSDSDSFSP